MRHLGTQILTTERLLLRPLTAADAIAMFENWASDPQVTRFLRWEPHKDWLETAQLPPQSAADRSCPADSSGRRASGGVPPPTIWR